MAYPNLTTDEIAALKAFAADYGRNWKSKLANVYWPNARLWRDASGDSRPGSILHGLRNSHGPSWLDDFKLPKD